MPDIIDYIVEQADRNDNKNLQYEQDIIFRIKQAEDNMVFEGVRCAVKILTISSLESVMRGLNRVLDRFRKRVKNILLDVSITYDNTAYIQCNDLIAVGEEVSRRMRYKVQEMKHITQDDDTIEYIQRYAFELLTGYTENKKQELRSKLGYLMLSKKADKATVRDEIQRILSTSKSKAEEIAQTELSMAFNNGMLRRLMEWENQTDEEVQKYWHGFKYSERTCEYCRNRIGNVYDLDDDSETLPAHPRCRCVWLPTLKSWDKPATNNLLAKANMLELGYSREMMVDRINRRLGIRYAEYLSDKEMSEYLQGERSTKMGDAMKHARDRYIKDKIDSFNIEPDRSNNEMAKTYNEMMNEWKRLLAKAFADGNEEVIYNSKEAIKGIMILPWSAEQFSGWNRLLEIIG